jgi:acyl-CoA thioester hydrolase/thioesterase-3
MLLVCKSALRSLKNTPCMQLHRSKFETELQVRPDDIDLNQHVHGSRYFDYVLAARYDQMSRCYKMSMEEFGKIGLGWFARTAHVEYKRPLGIGEFFIVRTWVEDIRKDTVRVQFEIVKKPTGKLCCDGYFDYVLVTLATGRATVIPEWIAEKYAV